MESPAPGERLPGDPHRHPPPGALDRITTRRGAMVQIIENWSELRGRVEAVTGDGDDSVGLDVQVVAVEPVPGFANLLGETPGRTIRVTLSLDGMPPPRQGDELRIRVRKAGPDRYFGRLALADDG